MFFPPVMAGEDMRSGQAFIAMHWGEEFLSGRDCIGVNALTSPAFDPSSKQPELKHAAVSISKAELPWRFVAFAWIDEAAALALQQALRSHMKRFAFASATLFGRGDKVGVLFRSANESPVEVGQVNQLFGLEREGVLRYDDGRRANARRIRVDDGKLGAVSLAGDVSAERWLRGYLEEGLPVASLGRLLLQPGGQPPKGFATRGKVVCACMNVSQDEIAQALGQVGASGDGDKLAMLQQKLKCGTSCGSCVPELKQLIASTGKAAVS